MLPLVSWQNEHGCSCTSQPYHSVAGKHIPTKAFWEELTKSCLLCNVLEWHQNKLWKNPAAFKNQVFVFLFAFEGVEIFDFVSHSTTSDGSQHMKKVLQLKFHLNFKNWAFLTAPRNMAFGGKSMTRTLSSCYKTFTLGCFRWTFTLLAGTTLNRSSLATVNCKWPLKRSVVRRKTRMKSAHE